MVVLKRIVERLRPLIEAQQWDYCVVWKLGDDLSRFIEWLGCCCGGGFGKTNVKEEKSEDSLSTFCRDTCLKHPIKSKACKALAQLPNSMPLYSGIHTEVVLSTEPMWLNKVDASYSNPLNDLNGTQVLIPVVGGVIELYSWKHIPKDQSVIDFVKVHCNVDLNVNARSSGLESLLEDYKQNSSSSLHLPSYNPVTQCSSYSSIEGSSGSSNPSNGHGMFNLNCDYSQREREPFRQSIKRCSDPCNVDILKQQAVLISGGGISADNRKVNKKKEKGIYQAKNLITERNRRGRIKGGLYHLRSLVPKITKMDMSSIIGDAIDYVHELQKEIRELKDELREMEEEDCQVNKAEFKVLQSKTINGDTSCMPTTNQNKSSSTFEAGNQTEVEVNEIGRRCCLVRLLCHQKRGGFGKLLEALDSLGLQVVTANVTTLNGKVQNNIEVEANMDIQPKRLRDSLMNLTL